MNVFACFYGLWLNPLTGGITKFGVTTIKHLLRRVQDVPEFTAWANDFCFSSRTFLLLKMSYQIVVSRKYLPTPFTVPSPTKHIHLLGLPIASQLPHVYCRQIFILWCLAMPSKSTSLQASRPFFLTCYPHSIHVVNLRRAYSFFLALDFFHRGHVFCIWQDTSRRKDYHQRCPWHKYSASFLANLAAVHNPLMVCLPCLHNYLAFIIASCLGCSVGG